jgi:lysophospholipase L1-like esterase
VRYLLPLLIIIGIFLYLNRSYAYFYNFQGAHFLANPGYQSTYVFNSSKSQQTKKLVVLGDSLMAGTGSSGEEKSPAYLIAQSLSKNENIQLINLAFPGVGVVDVLERQVPKAIKEKPDYIILMIGTNDVHNKMFPATFKNYYQQILDKLTQIPNAKITIINIPFIGSDNILLAPWANVLDLQINNFNNIIQELAVQKGLTVIDLYQRFKNIFQGSSDLYSEDEFHPSDKGYAVWANFIYENINH